MSTMKALVVEKRGAANLQTVPIPSLAPGEVLVKTRAIALNPTDWKHRDYVASPGVILGCDISGVVEKVAEGVTHLKVGDRVASFVHGGQYPDEGAFAEYAKIDAGLAWKIPESLSWEEAAALGGVGPNTAFFALYLTLNMARPNAPLTTLEPFLVWGGATSVGLYAAQLAKMSGYHVIATASPKNFDLVKSFGADEVYSYADADTAAKISAAHPTLRYALDCISEGGTSPLTAKSLGTQGPGPRRIIKLLAPVEGDAAGLEGIEVSMVLGYLLLGKAFRKFGQDFAAVPAFRDATAEWLVGVPELIEKGFRSNPLWKHLGGLQNVNEGLELLKAGKVSGRKVVFLL